MSALSDLFSNDRATAPDPLLERLRAVTLGEYEIRGELGRGGMAVVYLAKDLRLERSVAIKVMLPELLRTDGMAERFLQEARISARLQHPNIIIVHDVRQREEIIYFVMGLVDGCGLDELVRSGIQLPVDAVRWVIMQAAHALSYANGEGIVHRDVKPGNILLTVKGDVLVTDFGIAKVIEHNSTRTMGATIIGTPLYMSPEQVTGQRVSEASDQYSLGVTAYTLLAGSPPFSGDLSLYDLQTAHVRTRPVPIQTRRPDCPPALAAAVMRMLEKRPTDRWSSLHELSGVLAEGLPHDARTIRKGLAEVALRLRDGNEQRSRALAIETPVTPRPGAPPRPKPALIVLSPPSATLYADAELAMSARALTSAGEAIDGAIVAWTSSDVEVVTVSPSGDLRAVGPGTARIRAAIGGVYEEALVTVVLSPITRIELESEWVTLIVGERHRPVMHAIDAQGKPRVDATSSWLSRSPRVVQVVGAGELLGVSSGDAAVEIAVGAVRTTLHVRVAPRPAVRVQVLADAPIIETGDAIALRVEALDDRGTVVIGPRTVWSSDAPHVVHVDSAGTAIGLSPGEAQVTAVVDGVSGQCTIQVVESPIGTIAMAVHPPMLEPGETAQIELVVTDVTGRPRSDAGVTITSEHPAILEMGADGRTVTAVAPGDARLTARIHDARPGAEVSASTVSVSVRLPQVDRIQLSSDALDLEIGAMVAVTARCLDARRRILSDAVLSWQSLDPAIVTVDTRGQLCAVEAGNTRIRVTAFGAHDSSASVELPVRVHRARVASIRLASSAPRLEVGSALQIEATLTDGAGGAVSDRTPVWSSSDVRIAVVDQTGRVEACAPGQVTIAAQLDGKRSELVLRVDAAPLQAIRIQVPTSPLVVGNAMRCTVAATDVYGSSRDVVVQWSVTPAEAATVDAEGTVRAVRAGRFMLTAEASGLRDECIIDAIGPAATSTVKPARAMRGRLWLAAAGVVLLGGIGVVATRSEPEPPPSPTESPRAPEGIVIDYQLPQSGGLRVGSQLPLRALSRAGREVVAGVRWSVSPPDAAVIDSAGLLRARRADTVRVTAVSTADSIAEATIVILANRDSVIPNRTTGTLVIAGLPSGGSVRVDGQRMSGSRLDLEMGRRQVQLRADGYLPIDTVLAIATGQTRTLRFAAARVEPAQAATGVLRLRVNPWARVFVDGQLRSENGVLVRSLPEGRHLLRFENPNFVTIDTAVIVPRGDTITLRFTLQPRTP